MGLAAPANAISYHLPTEDHSRIISEELPHAWTSGLLLPQTSQYLAMAGPHGLPTPDYSTPVSIPFPYEELIFPRAEPDIAPPSTVHLSEASTTNVDSFIPFGSEHVGLAHTFGDEFFDLHERSTHY